MKTSAKSDNIGGVRTQKPPKKDHFMDAKSVRKTLKIFNLRITNAALMKLTMIIYLVFHGVIHEKLPKTDLKWLLLAFWRSVKRKVERVFWWNLPGLCNLVRPFVWHEMWGLNCGVLEGVARKLYDNWQNQGFFVIIFGIFHTALKFVTYALH